MPRVAILYLCTGAYQVFWEDFYPNFERFFLPECDKAYFVFTDAAAIAHEGAANVHRFPWQAQPWPYSTMGRFDAILSQEAALRGFDYLIFANANLRCQRPVPAAEVLPDAAAGQDLMAVSHLHTYGKNPIFYPYERRRRCRAAIPYTCGQVYVAGGFNGGQAEAFLWLCRELRRRTDADLADGIIAVHHDESQLNRLVAEQPRRFRVLGPLFCVPEENPQPGEYIRVLQKSRHIDMAAVKGAPTHTPFLARKWEAFCLNWLPYLWYARDVLLRRRLPACEEESK